MEQPLVELRNVSKSFGKVFALRDLDFQIQPHEIVGLIGDNGAGKSTLVRTIAGVHTPDKGEIYVRGARMDKWSPRAARGRGIETVYQDKALVEKQTISANIFLGRERVSFLGFVDHRLQHEEAERLMRRVGFTSKVFSPHSRVGALSGGERQGVAIARALYFHADLIILDEPTTGLSLGESQEVLDFIRRARDGGTSCLFVSHTMTHVYDVSDRMVVLDRGRKVSEFGRGEISLDELIRGLQTLARTGGLGASADSGSADKASST